MVHARLNAWTLAASYLFIPCRNLDNNFMPILGVGWTSNFEMFFYAVFAVALLSGINVYRFVGVLLGICAIGSYFRQPWWPWPSFYLDSLVLEFFFGMLIARQTLSGRFLPKRLAIPGLIVGFLMLLANLHHVLPPVIPEGIPAAIVIWSAVSIEKFIPRMALLDTLVDAS